MEELEKKIEEQACKISGLKPGFDMEEEQYYNADRVRVYEAFIAGVKSPETKAFHTQGMYTHDQVEDIILQVLEHHGISSVVTRADMSGLDFQSNKQSDE